MPGPRWLIGSAAVAACLALAACGGGATAKPNAAGRPAPSAAEVSPSAAPSAAAAPTLRGNAAANPACKLLTTDQVASAAGLSVVGVLGLEADTTNPAKHSESCTWFLDPKYVQSSLVVQYTVYAKPPAELPPYYRQVIAQGYGKAVPQLGDISKINKHVLDTVDRRAEIHLTLLVHADATAPEQAATVQLMRLVMAGIPQ
ncbi:MAG: DUF3558 family protein [Actinomycetota bacterium]|nr:DUF3558 family protein [Actinomycetota bacterium]